MHPPAPAFTSEAWWILVDLVRWPDCIHILNITLTLFHHTDTQALFTVYYTMNLDLFLLTQSHVTEMTVCGTGPVHFNAAFPCVSVICSAAVSLIRKDFSVCLSVTQSFFSAFLQSKKLLTCHHNTLDQWFLKLRGGERRAISEWSWMLSGPVRECMNMILVVT